MNLFIFHVRFFFFLHINYSNSGRTWFSHMNNYFHHISVTYLLEFPCAISWHNIIKCTFACLSTSNLHITHMITWWFLLSWSHEAFFICTYVLLIFSKQQFSTLTFNCIRNLKNTVCLSPFHTPACLKRWVIWQRRCLVYWELASVSTDCYLCGGSPLWLH